jgi:hypothetical protein
MLDIMSTTKLGLVRRHVVDGLGGRQNVTGTFRLFRKLRAMVTMD